MNIIYLKLAENWQEVVENKVYKWNFIIKRLEYVFRKVFNMPFVSKKNVNKFLYTFVDIKGITKFLNKKNNIQGVVLSEELLQNKKICEILQEKGIILLNGKWLFKYLITETIEYICEKSNISMNTVNVAILIKETTDEGIQTILNIVEKVKNISIITKEINKFNRIAEKLYEEKGIPIKVSNNKKRALRKEKIIINFNFTEKELDSYNVYQDSIIININNTIKNINKLFQGININNFEIECTKYDLKSFASNCVYESNIYRKDTFDNIKGQLNKDKIKLKYLIGTRGKVDDEEYKNFAKSIDKNNKLP